MQTGGEFRSRTGKAALLVLVSAFAGALLVVAAETAMQYTATLEFCASSCHEMRYPFERYRPSAHYTGRTGVRAICVDCHIPPGEPQRTGLKIYRTFVDIWRHFTVPMDTSQKYEAQRERLASNERERLKANDSAECRACHREMNSARQSAAAREMHRSIAQGTTCIDCHQGVGHLAP